MATEINNGSVDKTIEAGEGDALLMAELSPRSKDVDGQFMTEFNPIDISEQDKMSSQAKKLPQFMVASAANLIALTAGISGGWSSPIGVKLKNLDTSPLSEIISTEQESWIASLYMLGAIFGPVPAVNIAAIAAGIALGWSSPAGGKLKDLDQSPLSKVITLEEESWIGSLVALGAAFGPLPAGIACDKMGRKMTLLMSTAPFIISWFMIGTTCNITQIYAGRFLMGMGVGAIFTALPMYIGEIADDSLRGALGSFLQLFITVGLLMAYAIGPYVSFFWLSAVCFILPVVFAGVFSIFPDSPAYLISTGQTVEAKAALKKLRGLDGTALDKEIQVIQSNVDEAMANKGSIKDIMKNKGNFKGLLLSMGLVAGQQLSGINVVLFYTQNIFSATGSSIPPEIATIIIGVVQVGSSGLTPLVVERLGRRLLLLISAVGMCIALFVLGGFFYMLNNDYDVDAISFIPIVCLVFYMLVYCIGFGPLPWAVMGELFPANIKSAASTATASFCWFVGFLMTKFFSNIENVIGMAGAFWIFAAFCILSGLFVFKFLPETKGKSLAEIQSLLSGDAIN